MAYTVSFNAASLIKGLSQQLDQAIGQAVQTVALTTQAAWQQTVLQTPGVWQPIKDRYAASIKVEYSAGNMGATIYSDDPMAMQIETGTPARDLKRMLDTSLKTRVAKSGKHAGQRYMIIPFRHNTPGHTALGNAMPQAIYDHAKNMQKSSVTKLGFRSNQLGVMGISGAKKGKTLNVRSRSYKWGDRLPAGLAPKSKPHHATDLYAGMARFNTSSGKQNSSTYMTFRVMGEWSGGWIVPAKPGTYIVKAISEQAMEMLESEVKAAIAAAVGS